MSGWKPGAVALVDSWRGEGQLAFRTGRIEGEPNWCVLDGTDTRGLHDAEITAARPVLVLDPEDWQALNNIVQEMNVHRPGEIITDTTTKLQQAIRKIAPRPSPDEPPGLGAVVEDATGTRWLRGHGDPGFYVWRDRSDVIGKRFSDLNAVRVLSEGVTL